VGEYTVHSGGLLFYSWSKQNRAKSEHFAFWGDLEMPLQKSQLEIVLYMSDNILRYVCAKLEIKLVNIFLIRKQGKVSFLALEDSMRP